MQIVFWEYKTVSGNSCWEDEKLVSRSNDSLSKKEIVEQQKKIVCIFLAIWALFKRRKDVQNRFHSYATFRYLKVDHDEEFFTFC